MVQHRGRFRLTTRLTCLEEIEREVLSWGSHATVIGPEPLRQRLAAAGAAPAGKYGQQVERNDREQEAQLRTICQ